MAFDSIIVKIEGKKENMSQNNTSINNNFTYFLTSILGLVCLIIATQSKADDLLSELCSKQNVDASGKYATSNAMQCAMAMSPLRTNEPQSGNNCVCEVVLNMAFELKQDIKVSRNTNCEKAIFGDVITEYGSNFQGLRGNLKGGMVGAIQSGHLYSSDTAMRDIINALENKKVVSVSLSSYPIYYWYAIRNHKTNNITKWGSSHAVIVRSMMKDINGNVTHFVILDSSGPERLYAVPLRVFEDAYNMLLVKWSRGVFITEFSRI